VLAVTTKLTLAPQQSTVVTMETAVVAGKTRHGTRPRNVWPGPCRAVRVAVEEFEAPSFSETVPISPEPLRRRW
jgi:hypothetical protein